jgi:hypothetical protein
MPPGILYCFNTVSDHRVYKAGHTSQGSLQLRLKGYLGQSKPRVLVAQRDVDDARAAEALFLRLLALCRLLRPRPDLGTEWYEARGDDDDVDERHRAIAFLAEVVQRATRSADAPPPPSPAPPPRASPPPRAPPPPRVPPPPRAPPPPATSQLVFPAATTLPGLDAYFAALDARVARGGVAATTAEALVEAFEADADACPVLPAFLPYDRDARVRVARQRHWVMLDG